MPWHHKNCRLRFFPVLYLVVVSSLLCACYMFLHLFSKSHKQMFRTFKIGIWWWRPRCLVEPFWFGKREMAVDEIQEDFIFKSPALRSLEDCGVFSASAVPTAALSPSMQPTNNMSDNKTSCWLWFRPAENVHLRDALYGRSSGRASERWPE